MVVFERNVVLHLKMSTDRQTDKLTDKVIHREDLLIIRKWSYATDMNKGEKKLFYYVPPKTWKPSCRASICRGRCFSLISCDQIKDIYYFYK